MSGSIPIRPQTPDSPSRSSTNDPNPPYNAMVEVWINWSLEERTQEQRDKLQSCFTEWQNTDLGKTQFVIGLTPAQQLGLAQEANHNLRQWDQQSPQVPAAPASSSSFEGHVGILSRSAWGDEAGGAYEPFFLPEPYSNFQQNSSWWSPSDPTFLDASPELDDLDWTLDEELQRVINAPATNAALTTVTVPDLPLLAPAPAPPADWSGFGVFDSNPPTVSSGTSSGCASTHPTPATSKTPSFAAAAYPKMSAHRKHADPEVLLKRQRNKVAAQKYRQKKLDRITELEVEVSGLKRERDELRIKLAKQEAETAALRDMLRLTKPGMLEES
ncbi:b-ZIP transcription factor IDI-4 [Beauveria bassiana ARSEF 2860]|uniref:B-ZIP transcription factor IDI-4 n=1 Tax=Beauveria bassiana (strain ARSEF 2860) TaxID=655819 RepID=J5J8E8_BEAB2|nr:b-ZIP transcription factor IDI-4 [Beauveria bassiana ARSEF 2860]EJP62638.1 b-ZIP transcription factor IDI-4 [Beauveria bassiana ARSEF 2860]